jgi:uncharacterized protein
MGKSVLWLMIGLVVMSATDTQAKSVKGDCRKMKQWSDMMVCGNPDLSAMDARVDKAYRKSAASLPPDQAAQVREVQAAWVRGREKCQQDRDPVKCLHDYYERRIKEIVQPGD